MTQPTAPLFTASLVSGARTLTATTFTDRIGRAASGFAALGVRQGDCVALLLRNDFAFLEASLAAVRPRRLCRAHQLALQGRRGRLRAR